MIKSLFLNLYFSFSRILLFIAILIFPYQTAVAQAGRYWDQNLNSEAALLSGAVVAGESGIAAIYYNPATIPEMTKSSLSLSANLFSLYFFNARNALGGDLPADRLQFDVYPRMITLTLNPPKNPNLTVEIAYFTKSNEFMQISTGTSLNEDIIFSNPGYESYTADYYLRSKFQDYYGGAGFGYKISDALSLGFSGMISYKDDQYYNLITANAFTMPDELNPMQFLSSSSYHLRYTMFDVRLLTKLGMHLKQDSWSFGANVSFPSLKIFGDGTVVKQYQYSNIHKDAINPEGVNLYYGARHRGCTAHFKDPLSVAVGANYYTPSRKTILLFTAEYFFGLKPFDYIEINNDNGDDGYNYTPEEQEEWLSFNSRQNPVFNAGVAFKKHFSNELMFSGGFRTDFNYLEIPENQYFPENNRKPFYTFNVYHLNYGFGYQFKRGSITMGMQFSHGRANDQSQVVNLKEPVEYINENIMPLTGFVSDLVQIRYYDLSLYLGFLFNFMKNEQ